MMDIINATKDDRLRQPVLGLRFHLASSLATALAELHKADWLHKSISMNKIICFGPSITDTSIELPHIIGSIIVNSDWLLRQEHQHPKYRFLASRYRAEYDYYSFGIVLLEIGLWRAVSQEMAALRKSPAEKKTWLLDARAPYLASYMGVQYQKAVQYCLHAADDTIELAAEKIDIAASKSVHLAFEKNVVEVLASCSV